MTVSSDITEVIAAEAIPDFIDTYAYGVDLSGVLPWVEPVPAGQGPTFVWPRANELATPAGTKTEGNAFTEIDFTTDEVTVASGVVGFTVRLSGEAAYDARGGIPRSMLEEGIKSLRRRLNQDMLAATLSATSTVGSAPDTFTMANIQAGLTTFEALNPDSNAIALVCSPDQWNELVTEWLTSQASILSTLDRDALMSPTPGYKGRWSGAEVFTTPHHASDTGTHNAAVTAMGRGASGFGVAVWDPIKVVAEPEPARFNGMAYHFSARYGATLTNPARLTEIVTAEPS